MTHIQDFIAAGLRRRPATFQDLLDMIPNDGSAPRKVAAREDPAALQEIGAADLAIVKTFGTGLLSEPPTADSFSIYWNGGWHVLMGHLYMKPGTHDLDITSPLVLLHRSNNTLTYGAELIPLAKRVIAHSLLYQRLRQGSK